MKTIDTTLSSGKWSADNAAALKGKHVLSRNKFTLKDFATYVADHQSKRGAGLDPKYWLQTCTPIG
ncbi:MAG: hypothetical protein IPP38_08130 [Bacteroidetes bacterium]|nr:hypothetical protein [Bacteroidota bacterium]